MNRTKIEWCDFTLNPITGCKRGCSYCYARRIHERFHPDIPFSDIVFHENRLKEFEKFSGGEKVFVGSMSDIEYWEPAHTQIILNRCAMACGTTFMFLSKNPRSYLHFKWPENTMQGLTVERIWHPLEGLNVAMVFDFPRPFLSIEPLLGNVYGNLKKSPFETVIVGAMTGPGAVKPKPEWIQSVKDNVPADKIFWKSNIRKYL
jgi:protein gp37